MAKLLPLLIKIANKVNKANGKRELHSRYATPELLRNEQIKEAVLDFLNKNLEAGLDKRLARCIKLYPNKSRGQIEATFIDLFKSQIEGIHFYKSQSSRETFLVIDLKTKHHVMWVSTLLSMLFNKDDQIPGPPCSISENGLKIYITVSTLPNLFELI